MNKKITIGRIARKEINTKYGPKWKIGVQDKDSQEWFNAWAGAWNKEWKEGQVIEFDYNQTKYGNEIETPQSAKGNYSGGNPQLMAEIAEMKAMVEDIYRAVVNQEKAPF